MEVNNYIDPNRSVSLENLSSSSDQGFIDLDNFPLELIQEIISRVPEQHRESAAKTNRLLYKAVSNISVQEKIGSLKNAIDSIIKELEQLKDEKSELAIQELSKFQPALTKLFEERKLSHLDKRFYIINSHQVIQSGIIEILKKHFDLDKLRIIVDNIIKKENLDDKSTEIPNYIADKQWYMENKNILHIENNLRSPAKSFIEYPLYLKITLSSFILKNLEIELHNNFDKQTEEMAIMQHACPFAKLINNENTIINLANKFNSKDYYYFTAINGLLLRGDISNIKTAIRLLKKLKTNGFVIQDVPVIICIKSLLLSNHPKLILKLADVLEKQQLKEIFLKYMPKLLEGKYAEIAQELIESKETYDYDMECYLNVLKEYCIAQLPSNLEKK